MESFDVDKVLTALSDPKTAGSIESLMSGMDELQKIMNKFEKLVSTMDKMGLKAGIMRMAGAKMGVDVDTPLGGDKTLNVGVEPASKYHEAIFTQFNTLSEEQLMVIMNPPEATNAEENTESDS